MKKIDGVTSWFILWGICLIICILLSSTAHSQVIDLEDLYTTEQEDILNETIKEYKKSTNIEIYVVTFDSLFQSESEIEVYADNFFETIKAIWAGKCSGLKEDRL